MECLHVTIWPLSYHFTLYHLIEKSVAQMASFVVGWLKDTLLIDV